MQEKRRGRRPRNIGEEDQRLIKLQVYVNPAEKDRIETAARAAGFGSVSAYLRVRALDGLSGDHRVTP